MTDPIIARLDQITSRADEATPGPWAWSAAAHGDPSGGPTHRAIKSRKGVVAETDYDIHGALDAEFIAAARTDVPALVDALIRVLDKCDRAISFPTPHGEMRQACIAMRETAEIIRDEIAVALADETEGEGR